MVLPGLFLCPEISGIFCVLSVDPRHSSPDLFEVDVASLQNKGSNGSAIAIVCFDSHVNGPTKDEFRERSFGVLSERLRLFRGINLEQPNSGLNIPGREKRQGIAISDANDFSSQNFCSEGGLC